MALPTASTNGVHHATDEAIDLLYSWVVAPTAPPAPLPEAAFSLTLKGTLDGAPALLTARGQTAAEFKANLQAIRGLLDPRPATAVPKPAPVAEPGQDYCFQHQVSMRWNEGKAGRKGWYSHRTAEGQWCKGT